LTQMKTPKQGSSICEPKATTTPPPHNSSPEITSVSDGLGDVTTFAYDSDGNLIPESYPNHVAAAYAYNLADQPTTIADTEAGTTIASFGYARNADSLIATAAETTPTAPVSSPTAETTTAANNAYSYTPNDQLASANANPYTYDPAGNLTAAPGGAAISYDAADEATSLTKPATGGGTTTTTYGYSPLGERTSQTTGSVTTTLGYNQAGQLTSYGTAATYTYNGDGLRMTKAVTTPAGGVITSNFIWDTVTRVPLVLYDTTNTYIYGPTGTPVEQINLAANAPTYLTYTPSDSTWISTNQAGDQTGFWGYDAYGTLSFGTPTSLFGYSGQYVDATTGFVNDRARWYEPQTGGFTARDPAFSSTDTAYTYAGGDPVNSSDPTGLTQWCFLTWCQSPPAYNPDGQQKFSLLAGYGVPECGATCGLVWDDVVSYYNETFPDLRASSGAVLTLVQMLAAHYQQQANQPAIQACDQGFGACLQYMLPSLNPDEQPIDAFFLSTNDSLIWWGQRLYIAGDPGALAELADSVDLVENLGDAVLAIPELISTSSGCESQSVLR
jgi:RHS repeat-associated protein